MLNLPLARPEKLALFLVTIVAFALRLSCIRYGLPQQFDADEQIFVSLAGHMLQDRTLDPGWYGAPASTLITPLFVLYALFGGIGLLLGVFDGTSDVVHLYYNDVTPFYLIGRTYVVAFSVGCLVLVHAINRAISVAWPLSIASIFTLAFSPLLIEYGALIRMDEIQVFFNLFSILFVIRYMKAGGNLKSIVVAGALIGLATTSKYPGVVGVVPITAAVVYLAVKRDLMSVTAMSHLLAAGAASLLAAFASAPYLFIHFAEVLQHVAWEARPSHLSATSGGFFAALGFYSEKVLFREFSAAGTAAALVGLALMLRKRASWPVPCLAIVYMILIYSLSLQWPRWAIPLLPLLAIGLAFLGNSLLQIFPNHRITILVAVAALSVLSIARSGLREIVAIASNDDTRLEATTWIYENVPRGATILTEPYTPSLPVTDYDSAILDLDRRGLMLWKDYSQHSRPTGYYPHIGQFKGDNIVATIRDAGVDYVVISDFHRRYRDEADTYPKPISHYEALEQNLERAAHFPTGEYDPGRDLIIYQVR